MHHFQTKNQKDPSSTWEGNTPPRPHPLGAFGASILAPSALGVPIPFHLRLEHWILSDKEEHTVNDELVADLSRPFVVITVVKSTVLQLSISNEYSMNADCGRSR